MDFNTILRSVLDLIIINGVKIVISLFLIVGAFMLINMLCRYLLKKVEEKKLDKTVSIAFIKIIKIGLKLLALALVLGYLGFETGSIAALVTSLGVGIGLATQGALSNIAGGILLLVSRPFKVDDYIETASESGTVEEISIIYSRLRTPDNKVVLIPNGTLANQNITNYNLKETRRVDVDFGIAYSSDYATARRVILDAFDKHALVLKSPEAVVKITEYGESGIRLSSRCWVRSEDYWTVYFDIMEQLKSELDKHGIKIPYNQLEVHIDEKEK